MGGEMSIQVSTEQGRVPVTVFRIMGEINVNTAGCGDECLPYSPGFRDPWRSFPFCPRSHPSGRTERFPVCMSFGN